MPVQFIGFIGSNYASEIHPPQGPVINLEHIEKTARAHEDGGFDRALIAFGSSSPESILIATHAAHATSRLGLMIAHRPGFTQPTLAARQLATLDHISKGRVAVHIITRAASPRRVESGRTEHAMSVEPFPLAPRPRVQAPDADRRAAVRDSLANLASSVGVAACRRRDGPQSVLVRSLMRVSASPPRILLSIDKAASGHAALLAADVVGLSILSADQRANAEGFDAADLAGRWRETTDRPPTLRDALTAIAGPVRSRIDAGSHTLLILDLSDAERRPDDGGAPLVCFDQTYAG